MSFPCRFAFEPYLSAVFLDDNDAGQEQTLSGAFAERFSGERGSKIRGRISSGIPLPESLKRKMPSHRRTGLDANRPQTGRAITDRIGDGVGRVHDQIQQ